MQSVDTMSVTDAVADALAGLPRKHVARDIGASPRAVKNWQERQNPPSSVHLIELARKYKDIRAWLLRAIEPPSEEQLERDYEAMMRRIEALENQLESDR